MGGLGSSGISKGKGTSHPPLPIRQPTHFDDHDVIVLSSSTESSKASPDSSSAPSLDLNAALDAVMSNKSRPEVSPPPAVLKRSPSSSKQAINMTPTAKPRHTATVSPTPRKPKAKRSRVVDETLTSGIEFAPSRTRASGRNRHALAPGQTTLTQVFRPGGSTINGSTSSRGSGRAVDPIILSDSSDERPPSKPLAAPLVTSARSSSNLTTAVAKMEKPTPFSAKGTTNSLSKRNSAFGSHKKRSQTPEQALSPRPGRQGQLYSALAADAEQVRQSTQHSSSRTIAQVLVAETILSSQSTKRSNNVAQHDGAATTVMSQSSTGHGSQQTARSRSGRTRTVQQDSARLPRLSESPAVNDSVLHDDIAAIPDSVVDDYDSANRGRTPPLLKSPSITTPCRAARRPNYEPSPSYTPKPSILDGLAFSPIGSPAPAPLGRPHSPASPSPSPAPARSPSPALPLSSNRTGLHSREKGLIDKANPKLSPSKRSSSPQPADKPSAGSSAIKRRKLLATPVDEESYRPQPTAKSSRHSSGKKSNLGEVNVPASSPLSTRPHRVSHKPGQYTVPLMDATEWPTTKGSYGAVHRKRTHKSEGDALEAKAKKNETNPARQKVTPRLKAVRATPLKQSVRSTPQASRRKIVARARSMSAGRSTTSMSLSPAPPESQDGYVSSTTSKPRILPPSNTEPQSTSSKAEAGQCTLNVPNSADNEQLSELGPIVQTTVGRPKAEGDDRAQPESNDAQPESNDAQPESNDAQPEPNDAQEESNEFDFFAEYGDFDLSQPDVKTPSRGPATPRRRSQSLQRLSLSPVARRVLVQRASQTPFSPGRLRTSGPGITQEAANGQLTPIPAADPEAVETDASDKEQLAARVIADEEERRQREEEELSRARKVADERQERIRRQLQDEDEEEEEADEPSLSQRSFEPLSPVHRTRRSTRLQGTSNPNDDGTSEFGFATTEVEYTRPEQVQERKAFAQLFSRFKRDKAKGRTGDDVRRALDAIPGSRSLTSSPTKTPSDGVPWDSEDGNGSDADNESLDLTAALGDIDEGMVADVKAIRKQRDTPDNREVELSAIPVFWVNPEPDNARSPELPQLANIDDAVIAVARGIKDESKLVTLLCSNLLQGRDPKLTPMVTKWLLELALCAMTQDLTWAATRQLTDILRSAVSNPFDTSDRLYEYISHVWAHLGGAVMSPTTLLDTSIPTGCDRHRATVVMCEVITAAAPKWVDAAQAKLLLSHLTLLAIDSVTTPTLARIIQDTIVALVSQISKPSEVETTAFALAETLSPLPLSLQARAVVALGQSCSEIRAIIRWLAVELLLPGALNDGDRDEGQTPDVALLLRGLDLLQDLVLGTSEPDYHELGDMFTLWACATGDYDALVDQSRRKVASLPTLGSQEESMSQRVRRRDDHEVENVAKALRKLHGRVRDGTDEADGLAFKIKSRMVQMDHVVRLQVEHALKRRREARVETMEGLEGGEIDGQTRLLFQTQT